MMTKPWGYLLFGIILGVAMTIGARVAYKIYYASYATKSQKFENAYAHSQPPLYDNTAPIQENAYSEYKDPLNSKPVLKIRVINADRKIAPENIRVSIIHDVLAEKYTLEYSKDDYDILISSYYKFDQIPLKQDNVVSIYYTGEAYVGDPKPYLDQADLVMGFDFIDRANYLRVPLSYLSILYLNSSNLAIPYLYELAKLRHDFKRPNSCEPSKKPYFACFLASNHGDWFPEISDGVIERDRMFHKLSLYKKVTSGGKHLNNIGGVIPLDDTQKFLSQCKFIISYENTLKYPGYITEKPYQAWFAASLPIYNAHKSVLADINSKAIIFPGDFDNEDDLVEYIKKVDNDDKLYCDIWNQSIISDPSKDYEVIKDRVRKKLFELITKKLKK